MSFAYERLYGYFEPGDEIMIYIKPSELFHEVTYGWYKAIVLSTVEGLLTAQAEVNGKKRKTIVSWNRPEVLKQREFETLRKDRTHMRDWMIEHNKKNYIPTPPIQDMILSFPSEEELHTGSSTNLHSGFEEL